MFIKAILCLIVLCGVCITFSYVKLYEENERRKRQAMLERRRRRMYADQSAELYEMFMAERRTADMRGAVINAYKERCGE